MMGLTPAALAGWGSHKGSKRNNHSWHYSSNNWHSKGGYGGKGHGKSGGQDPFSLHMLDRLLEDRRRKQSQKPQCRFQISDSRRVSSEARDERAKEAKKA